MVVYNVALVICFFLLIQIGNRAYEDYEEGSGEPDTGILISILILL